MEKIIKDFPNYKVTSTGKILSCYDVREVSTEWKELKQIYDKSCGYMIVTLCHQGVRKNKRVHRLMMEAFVPNPENKAYVNHKDGNKLNNTLANLEWATPKENALHAVNTGLCDSAIEASKEAVLMYEKDKITFIKEFSSMHEAMRKTGIAYQNISKVCRGLRHTAGGYHWKYK